MQTNRIFPITILATFVISVVCSRGALIASLFGMFILMTAFIAFALSFVFSARSKQRIDMLFFGSCSLLMGLWFFLDCKVGEYFLSETPITQGMMTMSRGLLAVVFFLFMRSIQKENWGEFVLDKILDGILLLLILNLPTSLAVQWFFSYSIIHSPFFEACMILIMVGALLRQQQNPVGKPRSVLALGLSISMVVIYTTEFLKRLTDITILQDDLFSGLCVLVLINISWISFMKINYIRMEENNAMKEQLIQGRVQLMLSQIQPHFIYNALNSIHIMIRKDPDVACEMITNFSAYLRANMDAMGKQKLAAMKDEIAHIKAYVAIEKVRFPKIDVIYEIDEWNFFLPVLTIEPLVENAIKHGVAKTRNGGVVNIRVYKSKGYFYIEVKDNGVGFDTSILENESRSIGIRNVRYRLEKMMNGTLKIKSEIGTGTVAQIKIPMATAEGRKNNEDNLG